MSCQVIYAVNRNEYPDLRAYKHHEPAKGAQVLASSNRPLWYSPFSICKRCAIDCTCDRASNCLLLGPGLCLFNGRPDEAEHTKSRGEVRYRCMMSIVERQRFSV